MNRQSILYFILAGVFFGGTFVAARGGLEYFPPLLFVALRFDIAAVLLLAYVFIAYSREDILPRSSDDITSIIGTGVLVIGLANAFLFVGQQYAPSSVGAIVFSLIPILTTLFAAVLLGSKEFSTRTVTGTVIGLVGVVLVVSPDLATSGSMTGRIALFVGAVSAALGAVLIKYTQPQISSTVRIAWGLPLAAILSHGFAFTAGEEFGEIIWTTEALLALAYVSIFAGVLAYTAYFALLDTAGPVQANLMFYLIPIVSTIGGAVLLGESITPFVVLGFAIVFVGFAVIGSESVKINDIRVRMHNILTKPDANISDASNQQKSD